MTKTSSTERWRTFKHEALAVLSVAGSLTAALWIKRTIERLTHSKVIDPDVLRNGLAPSTPTTTTTSQA